MLYREVLVLGGTQTSGAESDPLSSSVDNNLRLLDIREEPSGRVAVRMADVLTSPTSLAANGAHCHDFAYFSQFELPTTIGLPTMPRSHEK